MQRLFATTATKSIPQAYSDDGEYPEPDSGEDPHSDRYPNTPQDFEAVRLRLARDGNAPMRAPGSSPGGDLSTKSSAMAPAHDASHSTQVTVSTGSRCPLIPEIDKKRWDRIRQRRNAQERTSHLEAIWQRAHATTHFDKVAIGATIRNLALTYQTPLTVQWGTLPESTRSSLVSSAVRDPILGQRYGFTQDDLQFLFRKICRDYCRNRKTSLKFQEKRHDIQGRALEGGTDAVAQLRQRRTVRTRIAQSLLAGGSNHGEDPRDEKVSLFDSGRRGGGLRLRSVLRALQLYPRALSSQPPR